MQIMAIARVDEYRAWCAERENGHLLRAAGLKEKYGGELTVLLYGEADGLAWKEDVDRLLYWEGREEAAPITVEALRRWADRVLGSADITVLPALAAQDVVEQVRELSRRRACADISVRIQGGVASYTLRMPPKELPRRIAMGNAS